VVFSGVAFAFLVLDLACGKIEPSKQSH